MLSISSTPSASIKINLVSPPHFTQSCIFDEDSNFDDTRPLGMSPPKSVLATPENLTPLNDRLVKCFHQAIDKVLISRNLLYLHSSVLKLEPLANANPGLINSLDPDSHKTALMKAAEYGNRFIVELLLTKGARNRIKNKHGKTIGHTALCHSLKFFRSGISLLILKDSRDARCCEKLPQRAWNTITWSETANFQLLSTFEQFSKKQFRPLFVNYASRECRADVMDYFITQGEKVEDLSIDSLSYNNGAPQELLGRRFLLAASCGDLKMVELFLKRYPKIGGRKLIDCTDENGATALHYASAEGHDTLCNFLIARGANTKARTHSNSLNLPFKARNATYDVYGITIQLNKQLVFALDCINSSDPQALMKLSQTIKDNMKSLERLKVDKSFARSIAATLDEDE